MMSETATIPGNALKVPVAEVFTPLLGPARYKGAHGGRGSGKSHFFADQIVSLAAYKPIKAVCLREFQNSMKHSVKSLIEGKIDRHGLSNRFESKQTHIEGVCGSLIIFTGMQSHNADSIKSLEDFDIAWFEEAQRASAKSLEMLRPTLRKEGSEIWFSWNRTNPTDPVEKLFYDVDGNVAPDARVVEANWNDNPWLTSILLKEMEYDRKRDEDRFQHVWNGAFQSHSEARVFKNWRMAYFDEAMILKTCQGPYYGADWGFAQDPTVLVCLWVDHVNKLIYIRHEAYEVGCKIQDTPVLFEQIPGARRHQIIADSARPETNQYMRDAGFIVTSAKKGAGSVEEGIEFLKSYDIVVHPDCPKSADELTHYSYHVDKITGMVTNRLEDKKNHVIDAMRYALENVRRAIHEFF